MIVYQTSPVVIEGGQSKVIVTDLGSEQLLSDLLKEMQKMNLHMALINDVELTYMDVG